MSSRNSCAGVLIGAANAGDIDFDNIIGLKHLVGELLALVEHGFGLAEADDRIARLGDNALDGDGDNLLIVALKLAAKLTPLFVLRIAMALPGCLFSAVILLTFAVSTGISTISPGIAPFLYC